MTERSTWKIQPTCEDSPSHHQANVLGNSKWITLAAETHGKLWKLNKSLSTGCKLASKSITISLQFLLVCN